MTLETRLLALVQAIGPDIKALRLADGDLTALNTTAKGNLVAAINEVLVIAQAASGGGVTILDSAGDGDTTHTWSADKIGDSILASINSLRTELVAGAGPALDTFAEIAAQLATDETAASALSTAVSNRVRYDAAQALNGTQQTQARDNIAAASAAALTTLTTNVGDTDQDLVTAYNTAKA